MLLQNFPACQVGRSRGLYVVVLHTADGPVHFENGQGNIVISGNSVFPQSLLQRVHGYVLTGHVRGDNLAIVDQQAWLALDKFAEAAIPACHLSYHEIQQQQGRRGDDASEH